MRRAVVVVLALAFAGSACGSGGPAAPSSRPPTTSSQPSPSPTESPSPTATRSCVDQVFEGMTERQRIGQLFMIGLADDQLGSVESDAIRDDHFGSVSFIETTTVGVAGVRQVTSAVQSQVSSKTTGNVGFFVAANQEGGQIQALQGPGFSAMPTAVEQGMLKTSTLRADAKKWGSELLKAGVNFNLAPVMDVVPAGAEDTNQPIGVLQRNFGNDPQTVGSHGVAFLDGMTQARVATSAKHFPGLGRVEGNTDFTANVVDDVTTGDDPYLQSFQMAVDGGVPFVMIALATYTKMDPDHLAVFSPVVMQKVRDMGFDGVIVSDDIGNAEAIASIPPGTRALDFLEAGGDMIISKTVPPAEAMWSAVLARAQDDQAFRDQVDGSVRRILRAKEAFGLLPCNGE
jgi:beta-N-acetylhexosaminidase